MHFKKTKFMKKTIILLVLLISTNFILSQEKIGNQTYMYGNLEKSIVGKTLIFYGVSDPKTEIKIIQRFEDLGVNAISWNKIFIPNYTYSVSDRLSEINKNEISTIIFIKPNGTSHSTQSYSNTTYSSFTNSLITNGSSGNVLGNMGLVFEIYNRADNFNKPRAVVMANADNMWGVAGTQSGLTLKIVDKAIHAFKNQKAYDPKGYFPIADNDYNKALIANPKNTDALFRRALVKSSNGDRQGAINDYDEIIKLENSATPTIYKMSTVYNNKAYCLVQLGSYKEALPLVEKALQLDTTEWYIWDTRAEILLNLGELDKCISDCTQAINIEANGNSYLVRGLAHIKNGEKVKGCQDLSKAGELGKEEAYQKIKEYCNKK